MIKIQVPEKTIATKKNLFFGKPMIFIVGIVCGFALATQGALSVINYFDSINDNSVWGDYNSETEVIRIFPGHIDTKITENADSFATIDRTYFHEKCHYFWYKVLTEDERNTYYNIYQNVIDYTTLYSTTSSVENFAESCSFFILDPNFKNVADKNTYNFLSNYVNELKTVELDYGYVVYTKNVTQIEAKGVRYD